MGGGWEWVGVWGWVKKMKGLSKKQNPKLLDTDESMVITSGKRGGGGRSGQRGINGGGKRLDFGL